MRIIAGTLRRRTLEVPEGLATRPTSDRLRETLFNVLAPRMEGADFLDLYAGSGAVGLEALSRGAKSVTFVERAPAALKVLRGNLERLGVRQGFRVEAESVGAWLKRAAKGQTRGFDVVFLDPPYDAANEYAVALGMLGGVRSQTQDPSTGSGQAPGHPKLAEGAVVIAEHRRKEKLADRFGVLRRTRLLEQGDAALSFYEVAASV